VAGHCGDRGEVAWREAGRVQAAEVAAARGDVARLEVKSEAAFEAGFEAAFEAESESGVDDAHDSVDETATVREEVEREEVEREARYESEREVEREGRRQRRAALISQATRHFADAVACGGRLDAGGGGDRGGAGSAIATLRDQVAAMGAR